VIPDLTGCDFKGDPFALPRDLRGADLSGCDLSGLVLHQIDLTGAKLRGALAKNAHFIDCSMQESDCAGLDACEASFSDCNLRSATLSSLGPQGPLARYGVGLGGNICLGGRWIHFDNKFNSDFHRAQFFSCDLSGVHFSGSNLWQSRFFDCRLSGARIDGAYAGDSHFDGCDMQELVAHDADFTAASFSGCQLSGATLVRVRMARSSFLPRTRSKTSNLRIEPGKGIVSVDSMESTTTVTSLAGARLERVDFSCSLLVDLDLSGARLESAVVYGVSAWSLKLEGTEQSGLIITQPDEPVVTVDDIELAQFIYLMLSSRSVRRVIDTLTSRVVLLLGNFGDAGMEFLNKARSVLRHRGYVPVVFDWPALDNKNLTETVMLLGSMAKFVIANLTDPRSVGHELRGIVPDSPSLPVLPVVIGGQRPYAMFEDFQQYPWVLPLIRAESVDAAIALVECEGLVALELKHTELLHARSRPGA
jgi:uncharacterized protein YjbI with pentapeptide repeats